MPATRDPQLVEDVGDILRRELLGDEEANPDSLKFSLTDSEMVGDDHELSGSLRDLAPRIEAMLRHEDRVKLFTDNSTIPSIWVLPQDLVDQMSEADLSKSGGLTAKDHLETVKIIALGHCGKYDSYNEEWTVQLDVAFDWMFSNQPLGNFDDLVTASKSTFWDSDDSFRYDLREPDDKDHTCTFTYLGPVLEEEKVQVLTDAGREKAKANEDIRNMNEMIDLDEEEQAMICGVDYTTETKIVLRKNPDWMTDSTMEGIATVAMTPAGALFMGRPGSVPSYSSVSTPDSVAMDLS